jgi:Zn-dependent protease
MLSRSARLAVAHRARRSACATVGTGTGTPTITRVRRGENVQLGRIFGVRVGVDWTWFIVLFGVIYWLRNYFADIVPTSSQAFAVAVLGALLLFASLVAHELGHALVARRLGLQLDGIDLWLLGGFTRTRGEVTTPGGEFRLAAAGPAVTAVITVLCLCIGLLFGSLRHFVDVAVFDTDVRVSAALALFSWLALINCFLLVFNLVPAFPLDGGRMAQAIAWRITGDRNRAARACARLGQGFGLLVVGVGIALFVRGSQLAGAWMLLIGVFLERSAHRAAVQSSINDRIKDVKVADIMDTNPLTIPGATSLLDVDEDYFRDHHSPWFAVVDDGGRYLGLLRRERVAQELAGGRPALTAAEVSDDSPPWRIDASATLEALLGSEGLRLLGAVIAVDSEGILRGVVTLQAIRHALGAPAGV